MRRTERLPAKALRARDTARCEFPGFGFWFCDSCLPHLELKKPTSWQHREPRRKGPNRSLLSAAKGAGRAPARQQAHTAAAVLQANASRRGPTSPKPAALGGVQAPGLPPGASEKANRAQASARSGWASPQQSCWGRHPSPPSSTEVPVRPVGVGPGKPGRVSSGMWPVPLSEGPGPRRQQYRCPPRPSQDFSKGLMRVPSRNEGPEFQDDSVRGGARAPRTTQPGRGYWLVTLRTFPVSLC